MKHFYVGRYGLYELSVLGIPSDMFGRIIPIPADLIRDRPARCFSGHSVALSPRRVHVAKQEHSTVWLMSVLPRARPRAGLGAFIPDRRLRVDRCTLGLPLVLPAPAAHFSARS